MLRQDKGQPDRKAGTGKPGKDIRDRIAGTGHLERKVGIVLYS